MGYLVLIIGTLLAAGGLAACTAADREAMFSTDRAPLIGRCDRQPGYPDPSVRPGCENAKVGRAGTR
ncbi:MAG: hypothetical protein HY060_25660 [Proteobacteria bacterium]|nr:hypothetical protein [Pseudomonadota bacterium]